MLYEYHGKLSKKAGRINRPRYRPRLEQAGLNAVGDADEGVGDVHGGGAGVGERLRVADRGGDQFPFHRREFTRGIGEVQRVVADVAIQIGITGFKAEGIGR